MRVGFLYGLGKGGGGNRGGVRQESLPAPTLSWTTAATDTTPDFDIVLSSPMVGDVVTLRIYSDALLTTLVASASRTLTLADITGSAIPIASGALSVGTYYVQASHTRGGAVGLSNSVTIQISASAPTLTLPTESSITATGVTAGVTTDTANGNIYVIASYYPDVPTGAQIEAGLDDFGDPAPGSVTIGPIASSGAKSGNITGLANLTDYYLHFVHKNGSGTYSSVVSSDGFTTLNVVAVLSSPTGTKTGQTTATIGVTTDNSESTSVLYYVITTSSTAPSDTQIIAGQNDGGTAAVKSGSTTNPGVGAESWSITGLTAGTTYYAYFVMTNSAGNSNVASATSFTTDAASYTQTRVTGGAAGYTFSATPLSNTKGVTVSWWADLLGSNGNVMTVISNSTRMSITRTSANAFQWQFRTTSNTDLWNATSTDLFTSTSPLTHFALSYSTVTGVAQWYVNGVAAGFTNTTAPLASGADIYWNFTATVGLFQNAASASRLNASIGDFWMAQQFIDLSTNINLFYGSGTPPDLTAVGVTPVIWFGGSMSLADWNANPPNDLGSSLLTFTTVGAFT